MKILFNVGLTLLTSPKFTLYNSGVCPFAQRPWIALLETGTMFEHRIIDLTNKPEDFVEKFKLANGGVGSGLVPLLEDHERNRLVIESDVVTEYIAKNVDAEGTANLHLYPSSNLDHDLIQAFKSTWYIATDCYYDILRATSEHEVKRYLETFLNCIAALDIVLDEKKDGPFLLGKHFSYAECICAPWLQRFYVTLPHFRKLDIEKDILYNHPNVLKWIRAVCSRPSVIRSKCSDEEMINAAKRYYVTYTSPSPIGV